MSNNVIICVGISGSGKSTWSIKCIKNNDNHLRINRDDIRRTMVGDLVDYYKNPLLHHIEGLVNHIEDFIISRYLDNNSNIVIDNTNLTQRYIKKWIYRIDAHNLTEVHKYDVKFKLFDCELLQAKKRVYERDYWDLRDLTSVDYIDKQYQQYISIKKWILETYPDKIIK